MSKTLFDAGWFPSGSIQIVREGQDPRSTSVGHYEDSQYNLPSESSTQSEKGQVSRQTRVQLVSNTSGKSAASTSTLLPAPSEVLHAVTKRFDRETEAAADQAAIQIRRQNKQDNAAKQADRFLKLEQRISELQDSSNSKNKKVSDQVRRMLIKSRATGRSDLKMQDRVYLHCMVDKDGSVKEDYRYFSLQDAIGRVLSAFAVPGLESELLIRTNARPATADEAPTFRRVPILIRLYEAIANQYLKDTDTVVIRLYNPAQEDATIKSVEEEVAGQQDSMEAETTSNTEATVVSTKNITVSPETPSESTACLETVINERLTEAIQAMDDAMLDPKKKKKTSASALKVKQMQMKSRAAGDVKRIKMEQRFFVELVTVVDDGATSSQCTANSAPVFVGQMDCFERLVQDCSKSPSKATWEWELLVPSCLDAATASYRRICNAQMSFQEAERNHILASFDRLILRYFLP
jgi:hypothetical protein